MHPRTWEASGHVENFTDPLVDCKKCKQRFRADQIDQAKLAKKECPECGGELTDTRKFNLMFKTNIGPVDDGSGLIYLRPETAQGIYVNYKNIIQSNRMKIPFGIAQVGKAFRNEIVTKNFIFRTCEFEQMEMQYFVKPGEDVKWFDYWREQRWAYYAKLGVRMDKLRWHQHGPDELAHYAKDAYDIEYEFPMGFKELEGVHNRTNYDLSRHQQFSGKDLQYIDQENGNERYIPFIIETSAGLTRQLLMVLCDAYEDQYVGKDKVARRLSRKPRSRRRRKRRRLADRAPLPPDPRADHRRRPAPHEEGRPRRAGPGHSGSPQGRVRHRLRPGRRHRPTLPPPGRDRHPLLRHGRLPDQGGRHRHRALPRLAWSRSASTAIELESTLKQAIKDFKRT